MENDDYFQDEEFSPIRSLLGLLTFSTILPIKVYTSIEYMTKLTWCWPFLHIFIGILAAICGYVSIEFLHLNSFFTATIVYAFLMIITGYNHLDGVMDMADGVMVHGEPEKKIMVMKDSSVGAGGVATLFLVASLTIGGLYNILDYNFIFGIIICEMAAKTSLLTTALLSKPLTPGIGHNSHAYFFRLNIRFLCTLFHMNRPKTHTKPHIGAFCIDISDYQHTIKKN